MTDAPRRFRITNRDSNFCGMVYMMVREDDDGVVLQGTMEGAPRMWFAKNSVQEVGPDADSVLRLRP